jgi:hypothetical protein
MNSVEQLLPTRWAAFAGLGSLLMLSPALFALLKLPHFSTHDTDSGTGWPLRLLIFGGPALVGLGMAMMAVRRLLAGIKKNVWTESELEALRRRVGNPVWGVISVGLFILGIGFVVADHGSEHAGLICFLIAPFQTLINLVNATKAAAKTQDRIVLNGSAAMRSEHWGDPPSGTMG